MSDTKASLFLCAHKEKTLASVWELKCIVSTPGAHSWSTLFECFSPSDRHAGARLQLCGKINPKERKKKMNKPYNYFRNQHCLFCFVFLMGWNCTFTILICFFSLFLSRIWQQPLKNPASFLFSYVETWIERIYVYCEGKGQSSAPEALSVS